MFAVHMAGAWRNQDQVDFADGTPVHSDLELGTVVTSSLGRESLYIFIRILLLVVISNI